MNEFDLGAERMKAPRRTSRPNMSLMMLSLMMLLRRMKRGDIIARGFRSSFSARASEVRFE
jgi:hypothetical protein